LSRALCKTVYTYKIFVDVAFLTYPILLSLLVEIILARRNLTATRNAFREIRTDSLQNGKVSAIKNNMIWNDFIISLFYIVEHIIYLRLLNKRFLNI